MSNKKRYIISSNPSNDSGSSSDFNEMSFDDRDCFSPVKKLNCGHSIVEMNHHEAKLISEKYKNIIVEEDLELELFNSMPGISSVVTKNIEKKVEIITVDSKSKTPIMDVTIFCVAQNVTYKGKTDKNGYAEIFIYENSISQCIVSPKNNYWSKVVYIDLNMVHSIITVELNQIDSTEMNWPAESLGMKNVPTYFTGKGVKIAIVDSGIAPHDDLNIKGGYNTLDDDPEHKKWDVDLKGHGTHCCGVIASKKNDLGVTGIAPNAEIYSVRIFPGGHFSDLLEAIYWCIVNEIDIISMSIGSSKPSQLIKSALDEASQAGIICIAASGNHSNPLVSYPAKYQSVIAVSAIGKFGTFPEYSAHALRVSSHISYDKNYFYANFSNFGNDVDFCAPGVAIYSTIPSGYVCWDGTSMACPYISGICALLLEAYPELFIQKEWRFYYMYYLLQNSCVDLGLPKEMQGRGMPQVNRAVESALNRISIRHNKNKQLIVKYKKLIQQAEYFISNIKQTLSDLNSAIS